ncbi:MAG: LptF/LptG family permease [Planctomycetales bacterium]|nr:LptF/LptG family permease [Planctomycetales bacterium]
MTRIDRYLLFLYVRVLLICFATLTGLLIVIHVFSNLDEFLLFTEKTGTGLLSVMLEYYGPYTLSIFERLSGMLALLALLFVIAWLNKTHEFTALMAAGVTKRRVVRPLLIASAVVILAAAAAREWTIPKYQDRLDRQPQDLTGELPRPIRPTFDSEAVALIQGKHLMPVSLEIVQPNLKIQGGPLRESCGTKISATTAKYQAASENSPAGYMLYAVEHPRNIDALPSVAALDGSPLLLTAKDTSWVAPGNCFLASKIEFEMLRGGSAWKQFASTMELIQHLRGENVRGGNEVRVQIHQRLLRPAIDWTILLLGMPVLLTRPERHMFWVAGACLGIVAGFSAVVMGLAALGGSGYLLSPALAIWLPLLIFFPWAWAKTGSAMES